MYVGVEGMMISTSTKRIISSHSVLSLDLLIRIYEVSRSSNVQLISKIFNALRKYK